MLGENIDLAADMLSDIACRPSLDPADIEREKGVVCEEILMLEDDPEDLAHETLSAVIYGDSPLARPILGTQDTVRGIYERRYTFIYGQAVHTTEHGGILCGQL